MWIRLRNALLLVLLTALATVAAGVYYLEPVRTGFRLWWGG